MDSNELVNLADCMTSEGKCSNWAVLNLSGLESVDASINLEVDLKQVSGTSLTLLKKDTSADRMQKHTTLIEQPVAG